MLKLTLKGLFAHKLRFALTALAVMLGVSFLSGTLVLTDTIKRTFDELFADVNKGTDAYVRSSEKLDSHLGTIRPRIPASLISEIAKSEGVARQHGSPVAQGQLQLSAQLVGKSGEPVGDPGQGAPTLGFIWDDFRQLSPWKLDTGRAPRADDEVVIDKGSADKTGYKVGDKVQILTQVAPAKYRVVGIAKFGRADSPGGASVTLFTREQAQTIARARNQFDGIAVGGQAGVSQADLVKRIRSSIDLPKIQVITGAELTKENQNEIQKSLSFFNTFLLIFALVALFVSCFIIFNTFSIVVAQRTKEMALLRAIGASGRQVMSSVLGESLVVGFLASVAGLGVGIVLAGGLKALLGSFGIDIPAGGTVLNTRTVVVALLVGTVVTVASAIAPSLRASVVPPIAAMRASALEGTESPSLLSGLSRSTKIILGVLVAIFVPGGVIILLIAWLSRKVSWLGRVALGLVVLTLGAAAILVGLFGGRIALVGVGAVVVFVGIALLGPVIARRTSRLLGSKPVAMFVLFAGALMTLAFGLATVASLVQSALALFGGKIGTALALAAAAAAAAVLAAACVNLVVAARAAFRVEGRLGTQNAERNPNRTASTAAALMIGVALVALITILASSTKASIGATIDKAFRADYIVAPKAGGFGGSGFSPELATAVKALPEIQTATGLRFGTAELDGKSKFLISADPKALNELFDLQPANTTAFENLGPDQIAVSKRIAKEKGWKVGDTVKARFPNGGTTDLTVAAKFGVGQQGGLSDYFVSLDTFSRNYPEQFDVQVYAKLKPGVSLAAGKLAMDRVVKPYANAKVEDQAGFKAKQEQSIDQFVNLIYALLFLAVIIAGIGIANTLALSIVERTREIGLLRAVGMTRSQLKSTIRWEAVIIALLGTVLGLVIGLVFGWAIVRALSDQGINKFAPPGAQLVVIVLIAALLAVLFAYFPARRAARLDVLKAISTE